MTAAHEQRLSDKRRLRLQSLCAVKGQKLTGFRRKQWIDVQQVIQMRSSEPENNLAFECRSNSIENDSKALAKVWKLACTDMGVGTGLFAFFFWRFFLPLLIELAKEWLASEQIEESTVIISGVKMGEAVG